MLSLFSSFRLPREEPDDITRRRRRRTLSLLLLGVSALLLAVAVTQQGVLLRAQVGGDGGLRPLTFTAKLPLTDLLEGSHTLEAVLKNGGGAPLAQDTKTFTLTSGPTACIKITLENASERGQRSQEHRRVRVRVRDRQTKETLAETTVQSARDGTVTIADPAVVSALGPQTDVLVKPLGYLGRRYPGGQALLSGCPSAKELLLADLTEDGKLDIADVRAALRAFRKKDHDDPLLQETYPAGATLRNLVTLIRRAVQGPEEEQRDED